MHRRHLPTLANSPLSPLPNVETARLRLGGRASTDPGAGRIVELSDEPASSGVILFVSGDELHVWTGGGRVRKTRRELVRAPAALPSRELLGLAGEVHTFLCLSEGARVKFTLSDGSVRDGTLVEKCRYGALVLQDDQHVMAIGFRKLYPAPSARAVVPS